jgi:hypothetical protein
MIPAMPAEGTQSQAERQLFPILRDGLDGSFTIFHSFGLLTKNLEGKFIDGEIDFLILSPARGLLVLEVKGGPVAYDGSAGLWYQSGHVMAQSPFEQASASKFKLRDFLSKNLTDLHNIMFSHGVCFPDVFQEMKNLPADADPKICITGVETNVEQISQAINRVMDSFPAHSRRPIDQKLIARVRQALMPHCEYGTKLVDQVGQEERIIFALTENQCRFLDAIRNHRRVLIEGCAGSGKTVMVVKKARELASASNTVLLLAFNLMIGEYLAQSVGDIPNITADTYHNFCMERLNEAGRLPQGERNTDFFEKSIPEAFINLLNEHPIKYDAVIVDEGQDFKQDYWLGIAEMVRPEGYFYIFYDPGQNVFDTEMVFPITGEPFTLNDNCRNTRKVFEALKPYGPKEMRLMDGAPEGQKVTEFVSSSPQARRKELARILHDLVNKQGMNCNHIVVIGGHNIDKTCLAADHRIGNFVITEGTDNAPNTIFYHTYMKFKGCEADAVILLDVDADDDRWSPQAMYTTMSRAKHLLYMIRLR